MMSVKGDPRNLETLEVDKKVYLLLKVVSM
jgi:hypothetical protein